MGVKFEAAAVSLNFGLPIVREDWCQRDGTPFHSPFSNPDSRG
jgi:hypothetical protein